MFPKEPVEGFLEKFLEKIVRIFVEIIGCIKHFSVLSRVLEDIFEATS